MLLLTSPSERRKLRGRKCITQVMHKHEKSPPCQQERFLRIIALRFFGVDRPIPPITTNKFKGLQRCRPFCFWVGAALG